MELVDGEPLDRILPPGGFSADVALGYAQQIADAVAHAHDAASSIET